MKMRDYVLLLLEDLGLDWDEIKIIRRTNEYVRIMDNNGRVQDIRY